MAQENSPARIGKTIVINGEVKGSEDLVLDGRVEGTVNLAENRLTIGPNANIAADLTAKDVLIQGHVQGNIVASGRVELRSGCHLEGDIRAQRHLPRQSRPDAGRLPAARRRSRPADRRQLGPEKRTNRLLPGSAPWSAPPSQNVRFSSE